MANSATRLLRLALTVAIFTGCAHSDSQGDSSAPQPGATTTATKKRSKAPGWHMYGKFDLAEKIRSAVILGNLQEARASAKQLADSPSPDGLPKNLRTYLSRMRQQADDVAVARNIAEAAMAVGRLGVACGTCHWQSNHGPNSHDGAEQPLPWYDPPDDVGTRMLRHEIGLNQMWQGLIQPSIKTFRAGTTTLTRAPLTPPQTDKESIEPGQHAAIEQIRDFATAARRAENPAQRAKIYGSMLTYCAVCHQVAPNGPS